MKTAADAQDERQLWDDAAFRERVAVLAAARGRSLRDIALAAGMSHDFLRIPSVRSGRSIEALLRIAAELKVSVCELIGVEHEQPPGPMPNPMPDDETLIRLGLVADVAAHLYVSLVSRSNLIDKTTAIEIVEMLIDTIKKRDLQEAGEVSPEPRK